METPFGVDRVDGAEPVDMAVVLVEEAERRLRNEPPIAAPRVLVVGQLQAPDAGCGHSAWTASMLLTTVGGKSVPPVQGVIPTMQVPRT